LELLDIENFIVIKKAHIKLKNFNVFIGPQANGKSIILKLFYFFKNFLLKIFITSIKLQKNKRELEKEALLYFELIFTKYVWKNQSFRIQYRIGLHEITISNKKEKRYIKFDYSESLIKLHRELKNIYKKQTLKNDTLEKSLNLFLPDKKKTDFYSMLTQKLFLTKTADAFESPIFMPAGRSFFANIQKNIFTFLSDNIDIEPLLKEFGLYYETAKHIHELPNSILMDDKKKIFMCNEIDKRIKAIIMGEYKYEDDQDWIISGKRKINLSNSSSGQQESLPMLLILRNYTLNSINRNRSVYIEELETHLFPDSQKKVVNLLSFIHNSTQEKINFFLTTHSPYVLTAINNLIMADNVYNDSDSGHKKKVLKIIDENLMINFESVSAYAVQNGTADTMLDEDNKLIDENIIDSVSDEFSNQFDALLEIKYGEK